MALVNASFAFFHRWKTKFKETNKMFFPRTFSSKHAATVLCLMYLWSASAGAQVKTALERYTGANAAGYLRPLATALGNDFNRGWYQTAFIPRQGFYLRLGANAMMAFIAQDDRTFEATTDGAFAPKQTVKAPSVVGDTKAIALAGTGGTTYYFPGGFDIKSVLFAAPQLIIGAVAGTELSFRYLAIEIGNAEIGDVKLFGAGLRHSLSQYFGDFPIAIAAGVFYQRFRLGGDFVDASAMHYGVQASKSFPLLTLYTGFGFDTANVKAEYEPDSTPGERIKLDVDAENGVRATLGANLKLAFLNLNADYSIGAQSAFSAGFGLTF
jgi:hypothetical protein